MAAPSVVLVDRSRVSVGQRRLGEVARALQTQVDRDFGTVWGVEAGVSCAEADAVPPGAWTIAIVEDPGARLGVRHDGGPGAVVRAGEGWTLAVSHVLLELLADPSGDRFMDGPDITSRAPAARVRYLVEVCDPCEVWSYEIDGVEVSDFVMPDYYRADAATGTAVDFLRRLRRPLEVPPGGCLSWQDPADGRWHLRRPDGSDAVSTARIDPDHDVPAIRRAYGPAKTRRRRRAE